MNVLIPRDLERMFLGPSRWPLGEEGEDLALGADWIPAVDVKEEKEAYLIKAELPEMKKEDVKITIRDGVLTLAGERVLEKEEEGTTYHRVERRYGSFLRSFRLPENIVEEKIDATFLDGVLTVRVPKNGKPLVNVREIDVH